MRIIRFLGDDHRVHVGVPAGGDDAQLQAEVLEDPHRMLGPTAEGDLPARRVFAGLRAVVADDDENMRRMIRTILERAGCVCVECRDGAEAINAIETTEVDLVVSDVVMPEHDGYDVFAAARRKSGHAAVVLVTGFGYDPSHTLVRATQDGLEDIVYKPFTPHQLLEAARRAVRASYDHPADALVPTGRIVNVDRVLAPILPRNVLCVGRNFEGPGDVTRSSEMATAVASIAQDIELEVFLKPTTSVEGPDGVIRLPTFEDEPTPPRVAIEGELALIIGLGGRNIPREDAMHHILGFTIAGDVTDRRFQTPSGPPRWMRGKGFDSFCPLGPALLTPDELPDLATAEICTRVNDALVRRGRVSDMIAPIPNLISAVSRHITLDAGTVLLTGAPPLLDPAAPDDLDPGDRVEIEIDGIGRLNATVQAGPEH